MAMWDSPEEYDANLRALTNFYTQGVLPRLQPNTPAAQPTDWSSLIPYGSAGFGLAGTIMNLIQNIQTKRYQDQLRNYYMNNWQKAASQRLSNLVGDAASRGWSGYPAGLANLTASAYAPYQLQAGQMAQSTLPPIAGATNPFDMFLKSLQALQMVRNPQSASQAPKAEPGIDFSLNTTRGGGGPLGLDVGGGISPIE